MVFSRRHKVSRVRVFPSLRAGRRGGGSSTSWAGAEVPTDNTGHGALPEREVKRQPLECQVLDHSLGRSMKTWRMSGWLDFALAPRPWCCPWEPRASPGVETLSSTTPLEETEALDAADLVRREEDHAHAVARPAAQPHPGSVPRLVQEAVGYLDGQTGAIAGVLLGAGGATMLEIDEDGQGVANDAMRGLPAMSTTKPKPHASCSKAGSYRPWARGPPVCPTLDSILASTSSARLDGWRPTGVPAPCAGALYPLRNPEWSPRGFRGQGCEGCEWNDTATSVPGARLRGLGAVRPGRCRRPFGGGGPRRSFRAGQPRHRAIAIDFRHLPGADRSPGGPTGEAGAARSQANCQESRLVATDAPRVERLPASRKDTRPPGAGSIPDQFPLPFPTPNSAPVEEFSKDEAPVESRPHTEGKRPRSAAARRRRQHGTAYRWIVALACRSWRFCSRWLGRCGSTGFHQPPPPTPAQQCDQERDKWSPVREKDRAAIAAATLDLSSSRRTIRTSTPRRRAGSTRSRPKGLGRRSPVPLAVSSTTASNTGLCCSRSRPRRPHTS